jgi:hypothetical protein
MVDGSTATGGRPPNPFEFGQVSRTEDLRRNHENAKEMSSDMLSDKSDKNIKNLNKGDHV